MKRPAAVLFALLRSTQALASTGEKARMALPETRNICLRLATRLDIPAISSCNLECLPENYNAQFYNAHLRQWPTLALVAEEVPHVEEATRMPDQDRQLFAFQSRQHQREPRIVAYVLGKVESRPILDYDHPTLGQHRIEALGHVTSLAVRHDYRRLGLAKSLMTQLHHHLENQGIQSVSLHVRTSNQAACRLYERDGYAIEKLIPSYYQDGEDAYSMKKILPVAERFMHRQGSDTRFGKPAWKAVPGELQLPRRHNIPRSYHESADASSSSSEVSSGASSISFGT
jgi:N-alpha-acetyltransferase 10/11